MKTYSPLEWVKIHVANTFGKDKETFDKRLQWFEDNEKVLEVLEGDEPFMYKKAVKEYRAIMRGEATGLTVALDATCSGLQILACLSGCVDTAREVNLVSTGAREDAYGKVTKAMNTDFGMSVGRDAVKPALMTHYYNSKGEPEAIFGEGTRELRAFYKTLSEYFTGAEDVMYSINQLWQPDVLEHVFTLPDGHVAHLPVTEMVKHRIEVDELDHATFTYQYKENMAMDKGVSLPANITHAIDGYVVREMIRRAHVQGFEVLTIHDSFACSPLHVEDMRSNYREILAEIAESNLLEDIARELTGDYTLEYSKQGCGYALAALIRGSEYLIC